MVLKNKEAYPPICFEILEDLETSLPEHLEYHSLEHTIDVANVCDFYIDHFKLDKQEVELIRIAAIAYDYAYIDSPEEHEKNSVCRLLPLLKKHGYSEKEIDLISGMIMATKIPQQPTNLYERILADADLDYLGRNDYDKLSRRRVKELYHYSVVSNQKQWLDAQIKFLENHTYHTDFAKKHRDKSKSKKLEQIKKERMAANGI